MAERFGNDLILLERIAAGGMAEVYRAKQLGLSGFLKTIAVKRILPNYASNEDFKAMFRAEANLSAMLAHQNIVQIFSNGEFNDYLYLAMEFVDGKNVRQVLARADKKKTRIPIECALYIVGEAAKGLDYAHNFVDEKTGDPMDIVHRDMSPQNIMLSYDGAIKIVDFGIAKAAARSGQTKAGVLKGKFGYMSPEQAQGMSLDRRTDIFAVGIILFELLTQRRLFTSDDDLKTLQLVKNCRVPRPSKYNPDVTPTLDNIVLRALTRERAERYSSSSELYVELHRYLTQKYPKFLPTDLALFLRELFAQDITEEKKKRDKANAEIPVIEAAWAAERDGAKSSIPENLSSPKAIASSDDQATNSIVSKKASASDPNTQMTQSMATGVGLPPSRNFGSDISLSSQNSPEKEPAQSGESVSRSESLHLLNPPTGTSLNEDLQLEKPSTYDAEAMRKYLSRPQGPYGQQSSKSQLLGRSGMIAAIFLVVLGLINAFGPEQSPPIASNEEAEAVQGAPLSRCPLDLVFDTQAGRCVPAALVSCQPPQILNQLTKQCESPAVSAASENSSDPVSGRARIPTSIDPRKVYVWREKVFSPSGLLNLNSTPRAQKIIINGKLLVDKDLNPVSTPVRGLRLKPGTYLIRMENDFFGWRREQRVTIENSRTRDLDLAND